MCVLSYFGCSEGVAHGNINSKGEDRDEHWSGGPEVDTQGIQVLPPLETLKLSRSKVNVCVHTKLRHVDHY